MDAAPRILLVRLGAIGDALRVLPALRRLRSECPKAHIAWAVEQWVHPVLAGHPDVDRFHVLDRCALKAGGVTALREVRRFADELRRQRFEVAVDLQGRLKSGVVSWLSRAPRRLGYARGHGSEGSFLFANERIALPDVRENRVQRFLHLLEPLGITPEPVAGDLGVRVDLDQRRRALDWYQGSGRPAIAAYPGSSIKRAPYQRWQVEKWAELFERLAAAGHRTVVFWGPTEEEYVDEILGSSEAAEKAPATSLPEMMAMLGCFEVFVGSNTAAMHMSWLQGVATAFFPGPAEPRTDAPYADVAYRALWAGQHYRADAGRAQQAGCVLDVDVDEAENAVVSLLAERLRDRGE